MTTYDAMERLEAAGRSKRVAAQLMGYAWLIQDAGWLSLDCLMTRQGVWNIRRAFRQAGVHPEEIDFGTQPREQPAAT